MHFASSNAIFLAFLRGVEARSHELSSGASSEASLLTSRYRWVARIRVKILLPNVIADARERCMLNLMQLEACRQAGHPPSNPDSQLQALQFSNNSRADSITLFDSNK
jgi:hypothetical protein